MSLTPEQLATLRAAAAEDGHDPEDVIAEGESLVGEDGKPAAREPLKIFLWNSGVLTANEIRKELGYEPNIPDGGMYFAEWMAKHGGTPPKTEPTE